MKLEKGARVWVQLGKRIREAGIILAFTDSRGSGDFEQVKVELLKVNPFCKQLIRNVYPKPVQSYLLTKRVESLPGEDDSIE